MIPFSGMLRPPPAPIDYWDDPAGALTKAGKPILYGEGPPFMANPWDIVVLNGDPCPGRCQVKASATIKFDRKKPGGVDGMTITGQGYMPGPVEIEVLLWTQEQWEFFQALIYKVWQKPWFGTKDIKGIDIRHPGTELLGIKSIVIEGVSIPEDGPVPQSKVVRIKASEYLAPGPKTATKSVKASGKLPVHKLIDRSKNAGGKLPSTTDTSPTGAAKDKTPGSA